MAIHASTQFLRWKWLLAAVTIPVLVALWWAFRPEKLWINQKVNESAPFDASSEPQPILTGRFEVNPRQTSGRATVYKKPGGEEYLRLSDFTPPNGSDIHVLLARSDDPKVAQNVVEGQLEVIDCGPLKSNPADQNYDLPTTADLRRFDAVLIYGQMSHAVWGKAKLEPF